MGRITVSLDDKIERDLRKIAKKETRGLSSQVEHLVKFYLRNKHSE